MFEYQNILADLYKRYNAPIPYDLNPENPDYNGGVEYLAHSLTHGSTVTGTGIAGTILIEGNDTSIVVMLLYQGTLFVCPGDIEPLGWRELWRVYGDAYEKLIRRATWRFLVAPHHGRKSGYSKEMMDAIAPHATLISDEWGESETHPAFRDAPIGVQLMSGETRKYYTTKLDGRVCIVASAEGVRIQQFEG